MQEKRKCPYCGEETSTALPYCEKCNNSISANASGSGIFKFFAVIFAIAGIIATFATWNTMGIASIIYLCAAAISATLMYGIGRIIDLLFQININIKMKK
ncbi:MAG: hypothetical protein MRZ61_05465 [Oscillospiraceae bacterium]|nr:hypothetical protein [Oscillospiraceae bacterium]